MPSRKKGFPEKNNIVQWITGNRNILLSIMVVSVLVLSVLNNLIEFYTQQSHTDFSNGSLIMFLIFLTEIFGVVLSSMLIIFSISLLNHVISKFGLVFWVVGWLLVLIANFYFLIRKTQFSLRWEDMYRYGFFENIMCGVVLEQVTGKKLFRVLEETISAFREVRKVSYKAWSAFGFKIVMIALLAMLAWFIWWLLIADAANHSYGDFRF